MTFQIRWCYVNGGKISKLHSIQLKDHAVAIPVEIWLADTELPRVLLLLLLYSQKRFWHLQLFCAKVAKLAEKKKRRISVK